MDPLFQTSHVTSATMKTGAGTVYQDHSVWVSNGLPGPTLLTSFHGTPKQDGPGS